MKTKFLSIAMAVAIAIAGFNASAQKEEGGKGPKKARKERVECSKQNNERECVRPDAECSSAKRPGCPQDKLFEGITLSPEQQAKLDAMKQKNKAEFDKEKQARKQAAEKQAQKDRQKMEKKMEKLDKEMKELLTPEQYQVFQSNLQKAKAERKAHKGEMKKGHGKKGHGPKGDCKKADCKKADCKKADCKKADCKKADCKKENCKKTEKK